jgi:hypothetical protein
MSTRLIFPSCHFVGGNYWIIKTTYQNRGLGVYVFKTLKQLRKILDTYITNESKQTVERGQSHTEQQYIAEKAHNFIIQKYIERPFLIDNRKFDIRVWVLINQDLDVFFYKEGYLRTSSFEYQLDECDDQMVHLTNNAVQRTGKGYGKFEDGNILDFNQFQEYIDEKMKKRKKPSVNVRQDLIADMKHIVVKTIDSVKNKLNPKRRRGCFELFGYDFMVDNDLTVWLIECNTNPCLDESSPLLRSVIPRMIDDAFRLTIDKEFVSPTYEKLKLLKDLQFNDYKRLPEHISRRFTMSGGRPIVTTENVPKREENYLQKDVDHALRKQEFLYLKENQSIYPLEGYKNSDNLWQKIMSINIGSGKPKTLLNLGVNGRVIRA